MLAEDLQVREFLKKKLKNAAVSRILIERPAKNARITIFSARPGVVIGKKGEDIENLKAELAAPGRAGGGEHRGSAQARDRCPADRRLDHAAAREAHHVPPRHEARDAERHAPGRPGHQDHVAGPPERHRDRPYRVVPRRPRAASHAAADIDYGFSEAKTTYGVIGVKVWVYRGDRLANGEAPVLPKTEGEDDRRPRGPRRWPGVPAVAGRGVLVATAVPA
jgi:small subunit ribosomal protein S3